MKVNDYLSAIAAGMLGLLAMPAPVLAGPSIEFADGAGSVRLFGRVQADVLLDSGLPKAQQDEFEWRSARLGANLRVGEDWHATLSVNLEDSLELHEASIEYRGWPVWIEAGRIQESYGLSDLSSAQNLMMMERPQPALALGADYGLGVAAYLRGERWGASLGAFGKSGSDTLDGRDRALTARVTGTPLRNDDWLLHLGAGLSQRDTPARIRFSARPETVLVSGLAVDGVRLAGVDDVQLANLEFALRRGPVLVQAEYLRASVSGAGSPDYDGWYVEAGWVLTGESREYRTRRGVFRGVKPRTPLGEGGFGAVELTARYSKTDLADAVPGGETGRIAGVGVNWTPVDAVRVQFNLLDIEERGTRVDSDTVAQMRVQFSF